MLVKRISISIGDPIRSNTCNIVHRWLFSIVIKLLNGNIIYIIATIYYYTLRNKLTGNSIGISYSIVYVYMYSDVNIY